MSRDMVDAYVEKLLEEFAGNDHLSRDEWGGFPFRHEHTGYTVRVVGSDERPAVRVWSVSLSGVKRTSKLLEELNEINRRLLHARCFWADDAIVFEDAIDGTSLNRGVLVSTLLEISDASAFFGPNLKEQFGGSLLFEGEPEPPASGAVAEPAAGGGMYL